MKKYSLLLVGLLVTLMGYSANTFSPKDSTAQCTYSITTEKDLSKLVIEYSMSYDGEPQAKKDSAQRLTNVFEQYFGKSSGKIQQALNETELEKKLVDIIVANPDLSPELYLPDDMIAIFALIKGKKNKEKAKQIYLKEHSGSIISSETSRSTSYINGEFSNSIKLTYRINLSKKKDTTLVIPAFVHVYDSGLYYSKGMNIKL